MEPDQLLAIAPSLVAIVIAALGFLTTLGQGRRSERLLKEQNQAADERAKAQREADEKHWRAQLEDEGRKRDWESEQQRRSRVHDAAVAIHQARSQQLRADASTFFAVVGEASNALNEFSVRFKHFAEMGEWAALDQCIQPWVDGDVQRRLSVATACLSLYGAAIGNRSFSVQRIILSEYRAAIDYYEQRVNIPPSLRIESDIAALSDLIAEELRSAPTPLADKTEGIQ